MCGISGIVNKLNKPVEYKRIKKMNDIISHRGPDDEGFFLENNFSFAHRRLSILDLTSDGHQPMHYRDKKYTITYNGEVYNYLEIKNELESRGYIFQSHTDTEVILASYDQWGESCVNKFNGMWAFSLFDKEKNIIFSSRDRFGIKPFYFSDTKEEFYFASEIKQILAVCKTRKVDERSMLDYLLYTLEGHSKRTFFKHIKKIPPGCNMVYDLQTHTYKIKNYYSLRERLKKKIQYTASLEMILKDSVNLRLRSDTQIGTCLSGGLDSSTITAFAANLNKSHQKIISITASSIDKSNDETHYAKLVSENVNIDWHTTKPSNEDFINNLETVMRVQEEPFYDPSIFMEFFVMEKAKKSGITVLLDGQGADEILFGYENNYQVLLSTLLLNLKFKEFYSVYKNLRVFRSSKRKILFQTFLNIVTPLRAYRLYKKSYVKKKYKCLSKFNLHYKYLNILEYQLNQVLKINIPRYLKYQDKSSMHFSIESRVPFLDFNVVEYSLSLDNSAKVKDGYLKYPLRKVAAKILPEAITWRTDKIGYEAPNRVWLKEIEALMNSKIDESFILAKYVDISLEKLTLNEKWKLFTVAYWEKEYNVEI